MTFTVASYQCDQILQNFRSLRQFFEASFSFWLNFVPAFGKIFAVGHISIAVNTYPKIDKNNLAHWSHCPLRFVVQLFVKEQYDAVVVIMEHVTRPLEEIGFL